MQVCETSRLCCMHISGQECPNTDDITALPADPAPLVERGVCPGKRYNQVKMACTFAETAFMLSLYHQAHFLEMVY